MNFFNRLISGATALLISLSIVSMTKSSASATGNSKETRIIVSLGDSYSSGEGMEPFYGQEKSYSEKLSWSNYDIDWLAHRSEISWPSRLYLDGKNMIRGENWFFVASSGAVIDNLNTTNQKKNVSLLVKNTDGQYERYNDVYELPLQLHVFDTIENGTAAYVTMTLSGNDIGFSDIIGLAHRITSLYNVNELTEKLKNI